MTGNEKPAQETVASRLESSGLTVDMWEPKADAIRDHPGYFEMSSYQEYGYENRPNIAVTKEGIGDGRSLTLSGHVDVVPVDKDEWSYDPWDASVEDNCLDGRGSNDMLGGVASILIAYEALDELGIELSGDLTLQTTVEEEDGGVGGVLPPSSVLTRRNDHHRTVRGSGYHDGERRCNILPNYRPRHSCTRRSRLR